MAFNQKRYQDYKFSINNVIKNKSSTPDQYMKIYKKAIIEQDYEKAKAITEVLKPLHYDTSDTHQHIKSLKR